MGPEVLRIKLYNIIKICNPKQTQTTHFEVRLGRVWWYG